MANSFALYYYKIASSETIFSTISHANSLKRYPDNPSRIWPYFLLDQLLFSTDKMFDGFLGDFFFLGII